MEKKPWQSHQDLACAALAFVLGLGIGWLDLQVTEVALTILSLLAAGLVSGLIQPAAAWRWAVLITAGLPIMATLSLAAGWQTAEPAGPDFRIVLVARAFALVGPYTGALIRRTVQTPTQKDGV